MQLEGEVMKAVQKVGVTVDKEELLKALKYDREQYEKGYRDGLSAGKWTPVSERLPALGERVLCSLNLDNPTIIHPVAISTRNTDKYWYDGTIVAWQPMPDPYGEKV